MDVIKDIFIFVFGFMVGMGFLSWWTLKSLKDSDLTLVNGKDTWIKRT